VTAAVRTEPDGTCTEARLALDAVATAHYPYRKRRNCLVGMTPPEEAISAAAALFLTREADSWQTLHTWDRSHGCARV
jgi:hypothetical protein